MSSVSVPFLSDLLELSPRPCHCRSDPKGDPKLQHRKDRRTTVPQQFLTQDFLGVSRVGRARLGHSLHPAGNTQRHSGNGRTPDSLKHEVDFEVSVYCILFRFPKQTGTRRHWFQYRFKHMQHWCPICTLFSKAAQGPLHWKHTRTKHTCMDSSWHQSWGKKQLEFYWRKPNFSTASASGKSPSAVLNCFLTSKFTFFFFFFSQYGAEQAVFHQVVVSERVQNSPRFTALETKPIFPLKTMPDANEVSHGDADKMFKTENWENISTERPENTLRLLIHV